MTSLPLSKNPLIRYVNNKNYRKKYFLPWFNQRSFDAETVNKLIGIVPQDCFLDCLVALMKIDIDYFDELFNELSELEQQTYVHTYKKDILEEYDDIRFEIPECTLLQLVHNNCKVSIHEPFPWRDEEQLMDIILCIKKSTDEEKKQHITLYEQKEAAQMLIKLCTYGPMIDNEKIHPYLVHNDFNTCIHAYMAHYNDPFLLSLQEFGPINPLHLYDYCTLHLVDCCYEAECEERLSPETFFDLITLSLPGWSDSLLVFIKHVKNLCQKPQIHAFFKRYLKQDYFGFYGRHEIPITYILAKMMTGQMITADIQTLDVHKLTLDHKDCSELISIVLDISLEEAEVYQTVWNNLGMNMFNQSTQELSHIEWSMIYEAYLAKKHNMMYNETEIIL